MPGADGVDLEDDAGRALSDGELIDRDAIWARKREVLFRIFFAHGGGESFARWREEQGQTLQDWATWAAISEEHGADWHTWPEELRRPGGPALEQYVEQHGAVVAFHAWLQWALELQFTAATGEMTVIQDLPIGFAGGGADAWAWQDVLAEGVSVGAPPDAFNSQGQDWGSPPLIPWRLRDADYEPFIQSIRATIAGAGGLRIDHVMGLFRLWWVPADGSAADGAYVRYPAEDLLDIVALESSRAQALVVGEDLGTVEDGVREAMAEHGMLSYRLLWFEEDDPTEWPAASMAAITTHDLPTVAGLWTGADVEEQRAAGTGHRRGAGARPGVAARAPARPARTTPRSEQAVERAHELLGDGARDAAVGHARRRRRRAAPSQHARDHRPAQLVAAAAGASSRTCPGTRWCRRSPARWPTGSRRRAD